MNKEGTMFAPQQITASSPNPELQKIRRLDITLRVLTTLLALGILAVIVTMGLAGASVVPPSILFYTTAGAIFLFITAKVVDCVKDFHEKRLENGKETLTLPKKIS